MKTSEMGIVEALSRIAETFGKLVVQHVQLLRSEVEEEARSMAQQGRAIARVVAKALPFILAGLMLASLGVAQLAGLALEPLLGRAATPLATLTIGLVEAIVAGRWLKRHLPVAAERSPRQPETSLPANQEAPASSQGMPTVISPPPSGSAGSEQPSRKAEETLYGAVGRA